MARLPSERLLRKRPLPVLAVTPASLVLFRLGELCNNRCPMCSNSGDPALWQLDDATVLRRADLIADAGFRRAIVTGGEPTVHPAFWPVLERLAARGVALDLNTHGRSFARVGWAERAADLGLDRAIVSLHSHLRDVSALISGTSGEGYDQTVAGIDALVAAGCRVLLNLVLTKHNLDHVGGWVEFAAARWGDRVALKVCFPFFGGKGGSWDGIDLRLGDVGASVRAAAAVARARGLRLAYESLPHCIHGEVDAADVSRSGFGETHYLDDHGGGQIYAMRAIEAELHAYAERCRGCVALPRCPGVERSYLARHGADELRPIH